MISNFKLEPLDYTRCNSAELNQISNSESGVSLILTFFIMIIILVIVLSISILLYSEVKVIRNIGNSVGGFYAADSGIEKVLYYDRQVLPLSSDGETLVPRGLCSIFDLIKNSNYYCTEGFIGETSIYCNNTSGPTASAANGCNPDVCDNCQIYFETTFDTGAKYYTTATISHSGNSSEFIIDSRGTFSDAERQIEISITSAK